ncbi:hypothetical protein CBR_g51099 [Chara braunii]|uniref:Major facilitator superfamily (MFS) profile domain-containing protein n=1 Tax=Chara braunii TaxID=69332 RepID=A0A388K629_CHABU|nr:hypothetical protein CBR_g51099 [Chara braunii]|eukprot:GBG65505.1 hypothetical protein CBR_g51099 [Chara braunii]
MATSSGSGSRGDGSADRPSSTVRSDSTRDLALDPVSLDDSADGPREYDVSEGIDALGFGWFQVMMLFYSGLAWVGDAMEMLLLSFVGPAAKCEWNLNGTMEGAVTSTVFVGMLFGAYVWGAVSDVKGRRAGFFMTACFTAVFGILSSFSFSYWWLILTRGLVGFGLGGVHVPYALFLEFVPGQDRAFWLVVINVFWTVGSIVEALLAWAIMPTLGWRWLVAVSAAPLIVLLILYPFLPESPRFLQLKGDLDSLNAMFRKIAIYNGKPPLAGKLVLKGAPPEEEFSPSSLLPSFSLKKRLLPLSPSSKLGLGWARLSKSSSIGDGEAEGRGVEAETAGSGAGKAAVASPPGSGAHKADTAWEKVCAILSPSWRRTTLLLWMVFIGCAFSYYGIVLYTTEVALQHGNNPSPRGIHPLWREDCNPSNGTDDGTCIGKGRPKFDNSQYRDVLLASFAEVPGLIATAIMVQTMSRRVMLAIFFVVDAVALAPFFLIRTREVVVFLLFVARAAVSGAFTAAYVYAPEVYPTTVRSTGLGMAAGMARIGGLICPFVAVALVEGCHETIAVAIFIVIAVASAAASVLLPIETRGKQLTDFLGEKAVELPRLPPR